MALNPRRFNTAIVSKRNSLQMAPLNDLESTVFACHSIHSGEDGKVFDLFDVRICIAIKKRSESS